MGVLAAYPGREDEADPQTEHGIWSRIAGFVARRPRTVWLVTAVVLAALTVGLSQLGATTLGQSDLFQPHRLAGGRSGGDRPALPGGHRQPGHHLHHRGRPRSRSPRWPRALPGVGGLGPPGQRRRGRPARPHPNAQPKVVDGRVELQATRADPPDSNGAERTIRDLREAVHKVPGSDSVVGGFTAINVDTADASTRDRNVIIPVVLW